MLRSQWFFLVALTLASTNVACGGGDSDNGGGSGGSSNKIDACKLVTQTDASTLFGQQASPHTGAYTPDPALLGECEWDYDAPDNSSQLVQLQIWGQDTYYSAPSDSQPFAIGDKGYLKVSSTTGVDIGWVQTGKTLMFSYFTIGTSVPDSTTKVEDCKSLAKKISSAL